MDSIAIYQELKDGGAWLGAARGWMQSNVNGGDTLTWGSGETVHLPFCKLEEFAMRVAIAAVEEDRRKQLRHNAKVRGDAPLYGAESLSTDGLCSSAPRKGGE